MGGVVYTISGDRHTAHPLGAVEKENSMRHATRLGRLGGLTIGLGIGAAIAATGTAAADPSSPSDPGGAGWVDAATGAATLPASGSDPAIAISIDGMNLLESGGATATSGTDDIAIAIGDLSTATATGGTFDTAFADGLESTVFAGGGNFDTAMANGDNDFVDAGAINFPGLEGNGGSYDFASVLGNSGVASAAAGNDNIASVVNIGTGTGTAEAGGGEGEGPFVITGSNDFASVLATTTDTNMLAQAGASLSTSGDYDIAAILFGIGPTATETGVNYMTSIVP
jgi:hypothetical protein